MKSDSDESSPRLVLTCSSTATAAQPGTNRSLTLLTNYPTESRATQKEKEKAHTETGERYITKKRPVVIQPGDDDCGEDDSSILEDTGEVFHYSGVPPPPNPYTKKLTYFE